MSKVSLIVLCRNCELPLPHTIHNVEVGRSFWVMSSRLRNLHTTATMVGGTLLCEGAHFIDAIRTFITKQANVVITPLFLANPKIEFGKIFKCAPSNM